MKRFSTGKRNSIKKKLMTLILSAVLVLNFGLFEVIAYAAEELQFFDELTDVIGVDLDDGNGGYNKVYFDGTNFLTENPNAASGVNYPSEQWTVSKDIAGTCYEVKAVIPVGAFDKRAGFYAKSVSASSLSSGQKAAINGSDMKTDSLEYLDIGFKDVNGQDVEPIKPISLSITMKNKAREAKDNGDKLLVDVYHIDESAGTKLEKVASIDEKSEVIDESIENVGGISTSGADIVATFEADSFSIFVINNSTAKRKITFTRNDTGVISGKVSGTMKSILIDVPTMPGAQVELTDDKFACKYVCTGCVFAGWYTKPVVDGTGEFWNIGDMKTITQDVTLYAQWAVHDHGAGWTPIDVTLGLYLEDGAYKFDPTTLPAGGKYYLTVDTTFTKSWAVQGDTMLCLNGYVLTAVNDSSQVPIVVGLGSSFELDDCNASTHGKGKITGGKKGCISITGGTFKMSGGVITENDGDGIKITNGTAQLYNGEISDNTGAGVYVSNTATATIYGGSIIRNEDHGVYYSSGTVKIEGKIYISQNTENGTRSNVYLKSGRELTVVNPLLSGTRVGIRMENPGFFTTGYGYVDGENKDVDPAKYFISDSNEYDVIHDGNEAKLVAPDHRHDIYGVHHDDDDDNIAFRRWVNDDSLPTSAGSYYLENDVNLTSTWVVDENITLCLNGKKIKWDGGDSRMIAVSDGAELKLTDCGDDDRSITSPVDGQEKTVNGGVITGASSHGAVKVESGSFNLYRGNIAGNRGGDGGAVYATDSGTFNMYGGHITNNKADIGGAVTVGHAANISAGTITNNEADYGGGIYISSGGTLTVTGSPEIKYNSANTAGGGIYFNSGATFNLRDNPYIYENSAASVVNNVELPADAGGVKHTITITGAITNSSGTPRIGITKAMSEGFARTRFTTGYGYSDSSVNNEDGTASTQNNIAKLPGTVFDSDVSLYVVEPYTDSCEAMLAGDYVVEYDLDGGTWKDTVYPDNSNSVFHRVTRDEKTYYVENVSSIVPTTATRPADPEKNTFIFSGWMVVENGNPTTKEYVHGNLVRDDIRLVALWEPETNEISYCGGLVGCGGGDISFDNCSVAYTEDGSLGETSMLVRSEGFDGYVGGMIGFLFGDLDVKGTSAANCNLKGTHVGGICGDCEGKVKAENGTGATGHILMSEEVTANPSDDPRLVIPYRTFAGEIVGRDKKSGDSFGGSTSFMFYDSDKHSSVNAIPGIDQVVRPGKRFYQPTKAEDILRNIGIISANQ